MNKLWKNRHKYLIWFWIAMVPVTIFTPLKESLLWVLLLSLYANIEASAAAQEAKKEKK
jgi:hypothetical protein